MQVANAVDQIKRLPAKGGSLHATMGGDFTLWCLVPAVLRLAAPKYIKQLTIATMGFNSRSCTELSDLMDAKKIRQVSMLTSTYFRAASASEFGYIHEQITTRGGRIAATRNHAKILAFRLSDGRAIVIESSSNLRSCNATEFFAMHHDAALATFHETWIHEQIEGASK